MTQLLALSYKKKELELGLLVGRGMEESRKTDRE